MDFFEICVREAKGGIQELYPDFIVGRSKDLMVRGRAFYAIWHEEKGLWSKDEYELQTLVDSALKRFAKEAELASGITYNVKYLRSNMTRGWDQFKKYVFSLSDNSTDLDQNLTFANTEVKKSDYASRRLPYPLSEGDHSAWDELVGTLYSVDERAKIEWAIGAVVAGDAKKIQKFLVLYGEAGTGKSTILNIIQQLFDGYWTAFEAKALGGTNNQFATEAFKSNPLVGVQHDGDLSKIEDNTKLNSIISHEWMTINEKFKPSYTARVNAFLFMGTNQPVKISDAKSGLIRRLIDVQPTGVKISPNHYNTLMTRIEFELGAIANHCLYVYRGMGPNAYNSYRPEEMMYQTDAFFNFIEAYYDVFKAQDGATLKQAYAFYKEFCGDAGIEKPMTQMRFRDELRNYFDKFESRRTVNGEVMRSYYSGLKAAKFKTQAKDDKAFSLVMDESVSLLDEMFADNDAQYANANGTPKKYWTDEERLINGEMQRPTVEQIVTTKLRDIKTDKLHFVKVPQNHIVIDFDLTDDQGNKDLEKNLKAASVWPPTYAELSKSGSGVHLHYNWDGDVTELNPEFSRGIEVKVYAGNSSLRRQLTKCNDTPVATINSGLPIKEKKVQQASTIQSERGLRDLILRNLKKEIHPGTKPSIDFIHHILEEAHKSGMSYDVSDLRGAITAFANNSTNQAFPCLKIVMTMQFKSDQSEEYVAQVQAEQAVEEKPVSYFDCEVYPNLFVICWKYAGDSPMVRMVNPTPQDVEKLFALKLVGFYNRRYDNHILYARYMGYDNAALFELSQKIVENTAGAMFGEAYEISYADIWEYASKKQGLKKWQIELGLNHVEMDIPWDQPVPPELVEKVVDYCCNDVLTTEQVAENRAQDMVARQILAELSGLSINSTTQKHTARIIFGNERNPSKNFVYTDLSEMFPGYTFEMGKSVYRGECPSEGGYVYAEPGMYENVAVLDGASMHPTSIENLNAFGPYTKNFTDLKYARLAIKHRDFEGASKMLDGKLKPYLKDESVADALSYALKIVINIVYGMTSAKFDNPFRDLRNRDNIVAKRGALFMIDLKHAVQEQGFTVAHIKTDSIKIPNATQEIIDFVTIFSEKYGYVFEHEATYEKFCLVNDAVYIARTDGKWSATGAQFAHPYVFKKLFSNEPVSFQDLCETKSVTKGTMYIDFDAVQKPMFDAKGAHFVGKTGRFIPVTQDSGGGILQRVMDGKPYAVAGTKGYLWLEAHVAENLLTEDNLEIDMTYHETLAYNAVKNIEKFGNFETFVA